MTHDEMIAVIQAHKEGKAIQQSRETYMDGDWVDCVVPPSWNFSVYTYRVKPEPPKPREWWVTLCDEPSRRIAWDSPVPPPCNNCRVVHVREVIAE